MSGIRVLGFRVLASDTAAARERGRLRKPHTLNKPHAYRVLCLKP